MPLQCTYSVYFPVRSRSNPAVDGVLMSWYLLDPNHHRWGVVSLLARRGILCCVDTVGEGLFTFCIIVYSFFHGLGMVLVSVPNNECRICSNVTYSMYRTSAGCLRIDIKTLPTLPYVSSLGFYRRRAERR